MTVPIRFETLSGPQKAAIFMLAVDEGRATRLLGLLEREEVKDISHSMSGLGRIDGATVDLLLQEFGQRLRSAPGVSGGLETTERLLLRFMEPAGVEDILEDIRGPAGRTVWDKLGNVDESVLAAFLKGEHPQTVAVILSRLEPVQAARVLAALPAELALEAVTRSLGMEVVQKEILGDLERTLRAEFVSNLAKTARRDNHAIMAEVFNHLDKASEARLLAALEERDPDAAARIKGQMFTFDDLAAVEPQALQVLIRRAGQDRVGLALKGAADRIRDAFVANMSERAARILLDQLRSLGPVRVRDVEEAQQFLVNMAKELAAAGEIVLVDRGAEAMVE